MSVISMPTDLMIGSFSMGQARYDMAELSDVTGNVAVRLFGPPRWRISMGGVTGMTLTEGAKWEALLLQLRGRINTLAAFDPVRTVPQGTLRGSPVTSGTVAIGATSMTMSSASGTLLKGDMLQIGTGLGTSQTVKVMADATAVAGSITVTFEPPARIAYAASTPVAWDHPAIYVKAVTAAPSWSYRTGSVGALENYALDMLEVFA